MAKHSDGIRALPFLFSFIMLYLSFISRNNIGKEVISSFNITFQKLSTQHSLHFFFFLFFSESLRTPISNRFYGRLCKCVLLVLMVGHFGSDHPPSFFAFHQTQKLDYCEIHLRYSFYLLLMHEVLLPIYSQYFDQSFITTNNF